MYVHAHKAECVHLCIQNPEVSLYSCVFGVIHFIFGFAFVTESFTGLELAKKTSLLARES